MNDSILTARLTERYGSEKFAQMSAAEQTQAVKETIRAVQSQDDVDRTKRELTRRSIAAENPDFSEAAIEKIVDAKLGS